MSSTVLMKCDWPRIRLRSSSGFSIATILSSMLGSLLDSSRTATSSCGAADERCQTPDGFDVDVGTAKRLHVARFGRRLGARRCQTPAVLERDMAGAGVDGAKGR